MSHPPLSVGAINEIYKGNEIQRPIVQVLGTKKLGASDRYRVLISDSTTISSFTMLATQLNNLVEDGQLTDFSIIEITRYAMSNASNAGKPRRIMILLEVTVKMPGNEVGGKIGNPTALEKGAVANGSENSTANGTASTSSSVSVPPAAAQKKNLNSTINNGANIIATPIAALSPYQNKWVIKARIASKSEIRSWNNSRGEGTLFNMDLVDESGEIRCTAFRDQVQKFYHMLEVGKIYYITRGILKPANKSFNTLKNDYEMTLTNDSEISLCDDVDNHEIPMVNYDFQPINTVETLEKGAIIDVLGICKEASDVQSLTARATGKELRKRDIQLVDMSGAMVTLTLWGGQAESFEGENYPVVAAKGVRIGEFNGGKNLSTLMSTVLQMDPDLPEAHRLRGWWSTTGKNEDIKSLSRALGGGSGAMVGTWTDLGDAIAKGATLGTDAEVFLCKATVNFIKSENAIYKACPTEACNKKIIDNDGSYRCEKCNKDYPNYKFRLLAQLNISDATGSLWVTAFSGEAEKMLGMTAQELGELSLENHDDYLNKYTSIAFQSFTFKLRMKMEYYNEEPRLKTIVAGLINTDYKVYNKHLLDRLKEITDFARIPSD